MSGPVVGTETRSATSYEAVEPLAARRAQPQDELHRRFVVGFPTRDEAATVQRVSSVVEEGLDRAGLSGDTLLLNADNDSADGTSRLFLTARGSTARTAIGTGRRGSGKGTNLLAILHAARAVDAERVVVFDADVRSVQPDWVPRLLRAVDTSAAAMAVPIYRRNRYEGNTTNHIVSPLLAAVFGVHVQQPIAGDFAFNRAFIEMAVSWPLPDSAHLYGIDVHLSANAAAAGLRLVEVPLGRKIHNPGFPKILFMSCQVIDALFHVIIRRIDEPRPAPQPLSDRSAVDAVARRPDTGLVRRATAATSRYLEQHWDEVTRLIPTAARVSVREWGLYLDPAAWAEVLADALEGLAAGDGERVRDHLVALYLSRVFTYWTEIERLRSPEAIDDLLDRQNSAVVAAIHRRRLRFRSAPLPSRFHSANWTEDTI